LAFGVAASALVLGCVGESSSVGTSYGYAGGGASSSASGSSSGGGAGTKPMLVVVDTDRTMNATPGDGVGVFTEYRAGGHWRVWWTCDTSKTAQSCDFDVSAFLANVLPGNGAITNVAPIGNTSLLPSGGPGLGEGDAEGQATTTTSVDGIAFDAPAGATITLDAKMDGQEDASFLFFVQDGKINGGYAGTLTDPLMMQPSAP